MKEHGMNSVRRFSSSVIAIIRESRMLGIRAGSEHRFTGVWVVVVNGRVFVRSWNNKSSGWYHAFIEHPMGAIQINGRNIAVRARKTRGERLMDSIDLAYGEKYHTAASRKYVRGFARPKRRMTTIELTAA